MNDRPTCSSPHSEFLETTEKSSNKASTSTGGAKSKKLTQYTRNQIMNHLFTNGCKPDVCKTMVLKFKVDEKEAAKFINEKARAAQNHVHEECDFDNFKNISNWLDYFKEKNYHRDSRYESAFIMIAISDMENHPDPKDFGGVDFRKIYRFLGEVMLGNPTTELNLESKEFLSREFENLISSANSQQGADDAKELKKTICMKALRVFTSVTAPEKKRRHNYDSVDPMGIHEFLNVMDLDEKSA